MDLKESSCPENMNCCCYTTEHVNRNIHFGVTTYPQEGLQKFKVKCQLAWHVLSDPDMAKKSLKPGDSQQLWSSTNFNKCLRRNISVMSEFPQEGKNVKDLKMMI